MAEEQVAGMSDVMQEDQSLLKFLSLLHFLRVLSESAQTTQLEICPLSRHRVDHLTAEASSP